MFNSRSNTTLDLGHLDGTVASQYDRFQSSLEHLSKQRKYLNYGYTTDAGQSYEDRQEALCLLVFEAAETKAEHHIVDVGFGSGEQDFLWAQRFPFQNLRGFNIASAQVQYAKDRLRHSDHVDRLEFFHGRAESLPGVSRNSVDRILAVECAFYFDRPAFYRRAGEVLRPGGRLVAADISFAGAAKPLTWFGEDLARVGTLGANRSLWEPYFKTIEVRSIRSQVLPGVRMTIRAIQDAIVKADFSTAQERQWQSMAFWSRLVGLGLSTGVLRYDLIVLERR